MKPNRTNEKHNDLLQDANQVCKDMRETRELDYENLDTLLVERERANKTKLRKRIPLDKTIKHIKRELKL